MFKNLLVLCTGNICRSPIAEYLLRDRLADAHVQSAGTSALVGEGADPLAVEVAAEHGLDLVPHRGQQATAPLLQAADLVLVMTRDHANWAHARYPALRGRVHLLGRWHEAEIADPYGMEKAMFSECYEHIERSVTEWIPRLG